MRKSLLLAGLTIAASPGLAVPTPITPFDIPLPGTTMAAEPTLLGYVMTDAMVPFTFIGGAKSASGTVQVRTVRGKDNKLSFYWKINNAPTSKGSIESISISDFPKSEYDANWRKDGLGTVAPSSVAGQMTADFKSWIYGFRFKQPIKPGESSRYFFLRSGATASKPATARLTVGGGATPDFPVRAPA